MLKIAYLQNALMYLYTIYNYPINHLRTITYVSPLSQIPKYIIYRLRTKSIISPYIATLQTP